MGNNKPKTNNAGDKNKVSQMDVCQTPPHAIEPLLPYIPKEWVIWESAVGPEKILKTAFEFHGYNVIGTDLMYGEEYNRFNYRPINPDPSTGYEPLYDIEVTNVPFSIKYDWIAEAFASYEPFALLVPYETTFAAEFKKVARHYHKKPWAVEVLSPERRINFKMPNMGWGITVWDDEKQKFVKKGDSAQMPTKWLTWGLEVWKTREPLFYTYDIPMRNVKYNADNTEKESHGRTKNS